MTLTTETAKTLLDQLPVGLGVWDAGDAQTPYDMRLVYANPWSLQHLLGGIPLPAGQTVREIEGIEIEGVYGRGANKEFIDGVFASAKDQVARTIELGHPDGSVYRIHYLPVGHLVTASIFEDITAVSEANMKLSMALESAKAGMWSFDYTRNTQSWDSGASSLTGVGDVVELADTSLNTFLSCISPKDRNDVESLLTRTLETPGALRAELEFRIAGPTQQITVMDRVRITREDGKATQAMHVLIDITDKAHLTAQLQQSNSDLKNFAHVASHDLREPLRVIANYVTLLFEEHGDKLTDPGAQQYREFIETAATRAMALVEDLLRFSRAGNNMNSRTTHLGRLVQIATENLKVAIDETGARVKTGVMPQITCDAAMMVQVLQNLIGNAVKFSASTGTPPEVLVTAEDKGAHWLVSVKDNGIGIDPQCLQKIFTPFYRLYSTAEYAGTGIGLALCHKIVRAHGGEIWAESGGQGQGTTLLFTLPKAA